MNKLKVTNFIKHYINAVFKTCIEIVEFNTIKSASQNTKTMLQSIAEDSGAPIDHFDELIDEYTATISADAEDIVKFYRDCANSTLLKIDKRQKKEAYITQASKIYKVIVEHLNEENIAFNEGFEIVLGLLHYELNIDQ
jgi:hypothetical protein